MCALKPLKIVTFNTRPNGTVRCQDAPQMFSCHVIRKMMSQHAPDVPPKLVTVNSHNLILQHLIVQCLSGCQNFTDFE